MRRNRALRTVTLAGTCGLAIIAPPRLDAGDPVPSLIACEAGKLLPLPPGGQASDNLGSSVAVSGDAAVVGAPVSVSPGGPGFALVFRFTGSSWVHEQALVPVDDPTPPARFGESVAVSGDVIMVGAPRTHDLGLNSGSVYVFRYDDSSWCFHQKLLASDGQMFGEFGQGVALSGDTAIISSSAGAAGSLYAFRFDGLNWNEEQKFSPVVQNPRDLWFARLEVPALSNGAAVVGADLHYCFFWNCSDYCICTDYLEVLSAFVFRFDGSAWVQEQELVPDVGYPWYGYQASISDDVVVMGAAGLQDINGSASGAAYVFAFDGSAWVREQTLVASDGAAYDLFGSSVAIDGDTIIVGASADDDNGRGAGSAYVFRRDGGRWVEEHKLRASDGTYGDRFGIRVAGHGAVAVVGAHGDDVYGEGSGSAYGYDLAGSDCNENGLCDGRDLAGGTSPDLNANGVPDECEFGTDLDGDAFVGVVDLLMLLSLWGPCPGPCPPHCPGDVDGDCTVGVTDMLVLLDNWGPQGLPPNDSCGSPAPIGEGAFAFSTSLATTVGLPEACPGTDPFTFVKDIWFLYTPACTGIATFSLCNAADFDSMLAVFFSGGQCPPPGAGLCSDNAPGCGQTSEIQVFVIAGFPYLVRVGGATGGGPGVLTITCVPYNEPG